MTIYGQKYKKVSNGKFLMGKQPNSTEIQYKHKNLQFCHFWGNGETKK